MQNIIIHHSHQLNHKKIKICKLVYTLHFTVEIEIIEYHVKIAELMHLPTSITEIYDKKKVLNSFFQVFGDGNTEIAHIARQCYSNLSAYLA